MEKPADQLACATPALPATSSNVTPVPSSPMIRARFFPTVITPCAGFIRRNIPIQNSSTRAESPSTTTTMPMIAPRLLRP